MSQFGNGPKPPTWGRPAAPIPAPFAGQFPGVTGGQFGMANPMGMMGMPLVNQAAFQQNNMSMGAMNMMAQQAQFNAANAAKMSMQQQQQQPQPSVNQGNAQKNQRTFVGIVTKMHDNYGFVDDDVFFQHSVIRGALPRVNDRVMVEASYNPNMPFKWNALRVSILTDNQASGPSPTGMPPMRQVPAPMPVPVPPVGGGNQGGTRWGPQTNAPQRVTSPRRRSPPRRSPPPRRPSPPRRSPPRRRSPSPRRTPPRRSSPPRRMASPHRDSRKRDRSPTSSTPHERTPAMDKNRERKDSASPPRRRARIIPRYVCNTPRPIFTGSVISTNALRKRFSHLYIPSDFVDSTIDWTHHIPVDAPLDFSTSVQYHVFHKDVDIPESEIEHVDVTDADSRYIVKVALLSHADKTDIQKKTWGLLPDGSTDDTIEPMSVHKNIHLLVGSRGKEVMGIGGAWSPSLDGADPSALTTQIKTAIRTTRTLTGIDLSNVSAWYQLVQVRYYRGDRGRVERVTLLLADTAGIVPDDESHSLMDTVLKEQLAAKLNAIDDEATAAKKEEEESASSKDTVDKDCESVKEEVKVEMKEEVKEGGTEDVEMESPVKEKPERVEGEPTHWKLLDVKALKVAELKQELEARSLEIKGIKTLLAQRLQEALDKEKEKEEKKVDEAVKKPEENEEKVDEKKDEKLEAEKKKEEEEKKKAAEKAEKERKERKASLEKHFAFPKEPRVLVFPSKTAKGGKFDCRVVSLASLLDYREADNKESQFEMSLFAEALRDVVERTYSFRVYCALVNAGDKEVEKKKREEAREVKKEKDVGGDDGEKKDDEKEKEKETKKKEEKIDLRSVVIKRDMWEAFAYFDSNLCGYVHDRDLEDIIAVGDLGIPRGQIQKLAKKLGSGSSGSKINYRHLTDSLVDPDGETRYVPTEVEGGPSIEELSRGYGSFFKSDDDVVIANGTNSTSTELSSDLVSIDGVVINVKQKLLAVKRLEGEKDAAAAKMKELETSLKNLRESKDVIDKKKKRLEEDVEKYQKRLRETEKSLKLAQDEVSLMKSGVTDMKDLARKMIGIADKTLPKKEKKKDEKKENGGSSDKSSKVEEDEEPMVIDGGGELTLADQVGDDDDNVVENDTIDEHDKSTEDDGTTTAVEPEPTTSA